MWEAQGHPLHRCHPLAGMRAFGIHGAAGRMMDEKLAVAALQRWMRDRRIRRAAAIVFRLPLELKQQIVEYALSSRAHDLLRLKASVSRVVMLRFDQCGVGSGRRLSATNHWRGFDHHFLALRDAFHLAARFQSELGEDDVRCVLVAASQHEHHCVQHRSEPWTSCQTAARLFVTGILARRSAMPYLEIDEPAGFVLD